MLWTAYLVAGPLLLALAWDMAGDFITKYIISTRDASGIAIYFVFIVAYGGLMKFIGEQDQ